MVICTDVGHNYILTGNQQVSFIKRKNGVLEYDGTTNEELLEVLLNRTKYLDEQFPCIENKNAILHIQLALDSFNERTNKRIAQGVETKDTNHVS